MTTLAMATPAHTRETLTRVDDLLVLLGARIARIVIGGELTSEQHAHLASALTIVDGLRELFTAERERQSGVVAPVPPPTPRPKES